MAYVSLSIIAFFKDILSPGTTAPGALPCQNIHNKCIGKIPQGKAHFA
jgi:hypothetical protein